ncbi:MAG: hypothetical protein ACMVY4_09435 [Minwuia sp.]|uniref:cell division protein FtsL n=1 Tax=Minwuia sp. TaxID=2493630 RepID=UPI003A8C0AC9
MKRSLTIVSALVGLVAIGAVYEIERRYDAAADRAAALEMEIEAAERDIHMLRAEWSYQVRPTRIEDLAARYSKVLALGPADPERIIADPAALPILIDRLDGIVEAKATEVVK